MSRTAPQTRPLLIVMDRDSATRQFVRLSAEIAGYDVKEAADSVALFDVIADIIPAILVLDLRLATIEDIGTMRALVDRKVATKIMLFCDTDMRSLQSTRLVARSLGLQIAAIRQKPSRQSDLTEQLTRLRQEYGAFNADSLRQCLDQHLVAVHYQPKLSLDSFEIIGIEALVRCRDAKGFAISPMEVIEAAEASDMIDELTERIFQEALQQRQVWSKWGIDLDLAVNLSPRCSFGDRFPEILADFCSDADVPTKAVTIELTETAVMSSECLGSEAISCLREKGFLLSIDDFGTGYSSLMRLKQLPFSEIKIDKSFVTDLHGSSDNEVIVKTIVRLAHGMDMRCVIEGVEDEEALLFAARLGCHEAQGYFIARPMPGQDLRIFLQNWPPRRDGLRATLAGDALGIEFGGRARAGDGQTVKDQLH